MVASASGALKEAPFAVPAGDEMVELGGVTANGEVPSVGRVEGSKVGALTGNKRASVGLIVGERLGVPDGSDDGLSEGHDERY